MILTLSGLIYWMVPELLYPNSAEFASARLDFLMMADTNSYNSM